MGFLIANVLQCLFPVFFSIRWNEEIIGTYEVCPVGKVNIKLGERKNCGEKFKTPSQQL